MTIEIYIILCESNYQKEILTSPAHGVHVFRSAKRTLSLFQLGHHICLLPSFHDSCFFLPVAAAAKLSRIKWTALDQRWDVQRLAGRTFPRGGTEASGPDCESSEGNKAADSAQSAVGLAERVLVMHFSRCDRLVPPATAHFQQLT